jgi:hypothetical protein
MRLLFRGALVAVLLAPALTTAHIRLIEPASWIVEDMRGDPQKLGPCGGTLADPGKVTGAITKVQGGTKLHVKVEETIFHAGHFRIALATNRAALPPAPPYTLTQTEKGPRSASALIQTSPAPPVLVDGLWPHTERPAEGSPAKVWETDVELPNITCERCTLQIIQVMLNHPGVREGGFTYHHCADLAITADPAKPIDKRWPTPVPFVMPTATASR